MVPIGEGSMYNIIGYVILGDREVAIIESGGDKSLDDIKIIFPKAVIALVVK